MGYAKEKQREKYSCPEAWEREKKRIAHIPK